MNGGLIAARYAKALLEYAYERDCADKLYKEMGEVAANFVKAPAMNRVLNNPMLSSGQKSELLVAAVGEGASEEFRKFVNMVISNRREKYFQGMAVMYVELYRKRNNINIASLSTATPVAQNVEERLEQLVANQTKGIVEFDTYVDPDLLGGFIFEMNYMRLDASASTQLSKIKKQLKELNNKGAKNFLNIEAPK